MIVSIFPGSTANPSLLTMCPTRAPLVNPNAHLDGFRLSPVVRHCSKHNRRWCKWSLRIPYTAKSSGNTYIKAGMYSPSISEMIRWNVVGAVFSPNIITTATNTPHSVTNVLFSWSSGCMRTWLYPLKPSKKLYISCPTTTSNTLSVNGKGNVSA